jgi:hypothetical protein
MNRLKTFFTILIILIILPMNYAIAGDFFTDGFESGDFTHKENAAGWVAANSGVNDSMTVSTDMAHSGSFSAKFHFSGSSDLADDAWSELRYQLGPDGYPEWYLSYYMYLPSNYVIRNATGTDNTKLGTVWGDTYSVDGRFNVEIEGPGAGVSIRKKRSAPYPYTQAACENGVLTWGPNTPTWTGILATRGTWTHWEYHFKMDTGAGDGEYQLWINNVKVLEETNINVIGSPCTPYYMKNGYLMGWSNSGFDQDTDVYIDDVVFSTTRREATNYIGQVKNLKITSIK